MGIKGDLDEIRELWPKLPLSFRVILAISFILSCLSITSIADSVFQLRGFIKEAVVFYQGIVTPITVNMLALIGLKINQVQADVMLLITIISGSIVRANYICNYRGTGADIGSWMLFMYLAYISFGDTAYGLVYGYFGMVCFYAFISVVMFRLKQYKLFVPHKIALANMLFVALLVSVLAAISEGLNRAL